MPDTAAPLPPRRAFTSRLARIGADHGFFDRIGPRHMALFVQEGDVLVLSFDRADRLWDRGESGLPLGFDTVLAHEFSLLSVMSAGRTWFRDPEVESFLQTLARDGFFASFSQVLIVAAGPDCGHAAARAAHLIPGARVLLSHPVAGVSPRSAPFETRFRPDRRANPDHPPPIGAEALAKADSVTVLFDGKSPVNAAQAALLGGKGTTLINLPHAGTALDQAVSQGPALVALTEALSEGKLTAAKTRKALRKPLRADASYLSRLMRAAEASGHPRRAEAIRRHVA